MRALSLLILVLLTVACTSDDKARKALEGAGYTNIKIGGYDPFSCGKGDDTCTEFEAKGPTGVHVEGVVGCGFVMKGCTIRLK